MFPVSRGAATCEFYRPHEPRPLSGRRKATVKTNTKPAAKDAPDGLTGPPPSKTRCAITGVLLGLANLVPGVSGGTMVLVMGLYDEFITSVADATRFKFTRRSIVFLGILVGVAGVTIASLAGRLAELVTLHPLVMYSLFAGMTLGGAPMLIRIMRPMRPSGICALLAGAVLMVGIAAMKTTDTRMSDEEKAAFKEAVRNGEYPLERAPALDVVSGVLGMSAMVLPGISGAYMLLLLGRYEQILAAVSSLKDFALSAGRHGSPEALWIIIPVAIGSIISLVGLTNLLKWLLRRYEKPTIGFLLGIVLGSVLTLWRMMAPSTASEHSIAIAGLAAGFVLTLGLSRLSGRTEKRVKSHSA